MKKPPTVRLETPSKGGPVVNIAQQIETLNKRDLQIQSRLGVIGAESAKLCAEQAGIQVRRLELMRSFDSVAKP